MPDVNVAPASLKCKICGGDLVNHYLTGACVCAHCGNKWSLQDLIPDYGKYTRVIDKMNQAQELLNGKADVAIAGQAQLMFKSAALECSAHPDAVSSDLMRMCQEGEEQAEKVKHYAKGQMYMEKKVFSRALSELEKIPGFRDTDELIVTCKEQVVIERKKRIPYAIVVSLILPTIFCLFTKEKLGLPLTIGIPSALILALGIAYAIYLNGTLAILLQILSFASAIPLTIFLILAYGFHMETGPAATTAIVAPIAVIVVLALKPERKE
ncbi:MAG: hypothetical protein IKD90_02380 [Clostridiales bacterium]|nr:hypothetical protein [Clostridiales bacterium]